MKNEEILSLIYLILDMENCVIPACITVEEESPRVTAMEAHNYLQSILNKEIGDPVLGSDLVDKAIYMNREDLLKEIEEIRSIAG